LAAVAELLGRESFFEETAALASAAGDLDKLVAAAVGDLARQQADRTAEDLGRWQAWPEWLDLTDEDRAWFAGEAGKLTLKADGNLDGLKKLLNHDYSLNHRLRDLAEALRRRAQERRSEQEREQEQEEEDEGGEETVKETIVMVPAVFKSVAQLEALVAELHKLRSQIGKKKGILIIWKQID
jgi:hypothetical protein